MSGSLSMAAIPAPTSNKLLRLFAGHHLLLVPEFMIDPLLIVLLTRGGTDTRLLGLFGAAPWLAILLTTMVAGTVVRKLNLRGAYLVGALVPPLVLPVYLLSDSLWIWMAASFVMGAGAGLRWVVGEAWVATLAPEGRRGQVIGLFETLTGVTFIAGPLLLGLTGVELISPVLLALSLAVSGLMVILAVPSTQQSVRLRTPAEGVPSSVWSPAVLWLLVGGFVGGMLEGGAISLLPMQGVAVGLSVVAAASLVSMLGVGSALAQAPLGWLADRMDTSRLFAGCLILITSGTIVLSTFETSGLNLAIAALLWGGLGGGLYTLVMIHIGQSRRQGDGLINGAALLVFAYTLGAATGPALGGLMMERLPSLGVNLLFGAVPMLALLIYFITQRHPASIGLRSTPGAPNSNTKTSLGDWYRRGLRATPTSAGVPIAIRSPTVSGINCET